MSASRNASMFFSLETRPTYRNTCCCEPNRRTSRGRYRSVSTPRVQGIRRLKPLRRNSVRKDWVATIMPEPALWKRRSRLKHQLGGIDSRAEAYSGNLVWYEVV